MLAAPLCPALAADHRIPPPAEALIAFPSNAYVSLGMRQDDVVGQLGAPAEKLSDEIWVYWDFRAKGRPGGERADTLIVVFTSKRVSRIRVTERQPVMALLSQLRRRTAERSALAAR